jgi:hypothetical protein
MALQKTQSGLDAMTFKITDGDFIRKAVKLAARKGRTDVKEFITELMLKIARRTVGLDKDLTVGEVAQQLECHTNTVKNYHKNRRFPNAYYRTPRLLLIPQKDVEALKKERAAA